MILFRKPFLLITALFGIALGTLGIASEASITNESAPPIAPSTEASTSLSATNPIQPLTTVSASKKTITNKPAVISTATSSSAPWSQPREIASFQALLQHSPFSLATAEDSSPLSERYMITGVITLDGEEQIFVMDRNDQNRELVTKKPNTHGMSLVALTHDDDPSKLKATIRVNGESGVITNIDLAENSSKMPKSGAPPSNMPYPKGLPRSSSSRYPSGTYPSSGAYPPSGYPGLPRTPSSRTPSSMTSPYSTDHRVIRRPSITSPSGMPSNYQPGTPSNYQQRIPNNYPPGMPSGY